MVIETVRRRSPVPVEDRAAVVRDLAPMRGSEYAVLLRRVRQAGLLERRPRYYGWKTAVTAGAFGAGWVGLWMVGDSWWQLGVAVFLAVVFAQLAFLGHDAGHRQIFATRRANHRYGLLVGNLATGVSIGWWTSNHNRHHAHPNTEGADPDVSGILAHSGRRASAETGWRRFVFRYQAWLFFPMLLLEAGSLHFSSVRAVLTWPLAHRFREGAFLIAHALWYLAAVFLVLSPIKALVFIAVHQGLFGFYMGCTFAPNHKGMPVLPKADNTDFLRRQVLTSRNIRGGNLIDTALGGLNYQIEHHLFPTMPRPALRSAQPIVQAFCTELALPYTETPLLTSYRNAVHHLATVSRFAVHPGNL
ncbi:acyl-CoA desaturase [Nocardia sp. CDC153]|uniref:fatty acid desaturase family protein n=1 Tax=Nocardia sp. CDC153 TaxID=3112167 RepID=UPI002DB7847F|nr:acyl-CoA desaturase [Nocardia sp. CDC153]MEC3955992.1 acyl-CoA desaturase [Nocardia sp. CDC153]